MALQDGRHSCLTCVDSIVVDTADCQPLYQDVLYFFESLSMPLPVRPPLMLVESSALNDAEDKEGIAHRQVGSLSYPVPPWLSPLNSASGCLIPTCPSPARYSALCPGAGLSHPRPVPQ